MVESWVEPAISATENTIISIAGSASEAIITSREAPMPPKLVPISIAGQRLQEARAAEQRGDGDQVAGPGEHQAGGEGRHQRRGDPGDGEDQIGRGAEQPGGIVRQHHLLAEQAAQVAIGLDQRRRPGGVAAAPSPCAPARSAAAPAAAPAIICTPWISQRRDQPCDHCHSASASSSTHQGGEDEAEIAADGQELQMFSRSATADTAPAIGA